MARAADLIGVASGVGGADPACAQAPARLRAGGIEAHLRRGGADVSWVETLLPERSGGGVARTVAQLCTRLAARVAQSLRAGRMPCVIGGDHSCAIGTWAGAARALEPRGRLGLIWIDAHMDSHTPRSSPSGRLHGMPLAALLGECDEPLDGLVAGVIQPRDICLVGVRSYESAEAALLQRLGVRVIGMDAVRRDGLERCMQQARAVACEGTLAYGVTLDLDALDPREAPAVATPAAGGLYGEELVAALAADGQDARLAAFELAEYCPRLDRDGRSEQLIRRILRAALGATADDANVAANAIEGA